jgi:hypothetical protein
MRERYSLGSLSRVITYCPRMELMQVWIVVTDLAAGWSSSTSLDSKSAPLVILQCVGLQTLCTLQLDGHESKT